MKVLNYILAACLATSLSIAVANTNGFVAVPASAFSEIDSKSSDEPGSYKGNSTGTSRDFKGTMFAPVNLPHGSIVTSFACGGKTNGGFLVGFKLRRNEPQQENIDMASIESARETEEGLINTGMGIAGYQFLNTNSIGSANIDNSKFNYFIAASPINPLPNTTSPIRPNCIDRCVSVNYCNVGYTIVEPDPSENAGTTAGH
ncbi:hypothetical protein DFR30_1073 [Thiogranum longum]|uniref:Uncharacterized protein n=2 Tax=Thiogranum longum TaxID=1537524 RepID=A0A4R1HBC6_9GAMM|nr:hypothetical protein DFR30_1073 [Thiogranum longum]